jgi:hypothetical protein
VLLGVATELDRAAAVGDRPAADAAVRELHDLLTSHADFEERGVFAELRASDVDADYVGRFEEEHARVHALLDECGADGWPGTARDLVAVLGAHIDREETDLFPAAHQLLTPAQWDAVDAVRRFGRR